MTVGKDPGGRNFYFRQGRFWGKLIFDLEQKRRLLNFHRFKLTTGEKKITFLSTATKERDIKSYFSNFELI